MRISSRSLSLLTLLLSGALLLSTTGCGSSNPNISSAKSNLESGNYQQALSSVEKALAKNPRNAQAHLLKGNILYQQSRQQVMQNPERSTELVAEMKDAYDRAVELDPSLQSNVRVRLLQAYRQARQQGAKAYNQAQQQQSEAAYQQAAAALRTVEIIRPDSAFAPLYQAFAYINAQQPEKATAPLRRAIEAGADSTGNYVLLSQLYSQQQKGDSAIALLEKATRENPDDPTLESELLNAYVRAGQTERAMTAYEEALRANPNNATYRYNYGSMLLKANRYDEAIEQLQQVVEMAPKNANAQFNLGAAYLNKAVGLSDQISAMQDTLRQERTQLSQQELTDRRDRIDQLVKRRRRLFRETIGPMEKARELVNGGSSDASLNMQSLCRALYQAYANTDQSEKAQSVAGCAGFEDSGGGGNGSGQ